MTVGAQSATPIPAHDADPAQDPPRPADKTVRGPVMGTSSIAPQSFTGVSSYSADFQSILSRAVNIASLPLKQLQNTESNLLQKKTQLSSFGDSIGALATSFQGLATAVSTNGISASTSNATVVTAAASGAQSAASYTINSVTSLASTASETSAVGYADSAATQISPTGSLKLVVGSKSFNINLSNSKNNLLGLRDAINSLGAGVTASILTTGTGANPNYLSISANTKGHTTLQLLDDPSGANANLLTNANQGSDTVFQLNGITVTRQSNVVNDVVPGVSFTLQSTASSATTITLSTSRSALANALNDFVGKYNGAADQVGAQIGKAAGLLSGNSIISQTASTLRKISSFGGAASTSGNAVQNLSDLGVTFDTHGHASFDATKLNGFNDAQLTSAFTFIGDSSKGFAALANDISQISDPVTGLIKIQQDSYDRSDSNLKTQISDLQDRINFLQLGTNRRLQNADSLLASLESQQRVITASIQSVNLALFGKNQG